MDENTTPAASEETTEPDGRLARLRANPTFGKTVAVVAMALLTVAALVVAAVSTLVVVGAFVVAAGMGFEDVFESTSTSVFAALLVATQLGFLVTGLVYARLRSLEIPIGRPSTRDLKYTVGGTLAALAVAMVLILLTELLGITPEAVLEEEAALNPEVLVVLAVLSVVLVAPAEEYLFRGVIQGRLGRSFGPVGAVAGASLLFGSMHLFNYVGLQSMIVGMLLISGIGAVFGIIYERTDNLTVPIVAHAVYNVILMGISYAIL